MTTLLARRSEINKLTEYRVSLTQELLAGIKFVKIFGWEASFLDRFTKIRKREIHAVRRLVDFRNALMSIGMVIPILGAMLSFALYSSSLNHGVTAARIFSSIGLFNAMRQPLGILPTGIGHLLDALTAISRIQSFLQAGEAEDSTKWDFGNRSAVIINDASFTWEAAVEQHQTEGSENSLDEGARTDDVPLEERPKRMPFERSSSLESQQFSKPLRKVDDWSDDGNRAFKIAEVSLTIGRNELVAIIGDVGSGKSSLLAALAGQMRQTAGKVTFGATRAYCPENSWIQNATVRDNILFGNAFRRKWYNEVLNACALVSDMNGFANGDATEIGERGVVSLPTSLIPMLTS